MLCLSAQSNPQGVPKELLEAKKLELIQEKVGYVAVGFGGSELMFGFRSIARKLPKRPNAAKSKSDSEIETSRTSGKGRGAIEEAVAGAEAIEEATVISTGVRYATQGLHLLDAGAHLAFVVPHLNVRLIHIFHLAELDVDQTTGAADRLHLEDRLHILAPDLGPHHVEDMQTMIPQDHAVATVQTDLEPLHVGTTEEIETKKSGDVVMTEQDPTHLQIPHAHVPPEEFEKDAPQPRPLVAPHLLQEPDIMAEEGLRQLH